MNHKTNSNDLKSSSLRQVGGKKLDVLFFLNLYKIVNKHKPMVLFFSKALSSTHNDLDNHVCKIFKCVIVPSVLRFATIFACPFLFYFIFVIVRIILIFLAMHPECSVTYYTENFYPGRLLTQIWLRLSLHGLRTILLKISFCPHLRLCKALIWWVFRATFLSFPCGIFLFVLL